MGTIIEKGTTVQIVPSMAVPEKYWYMLGTVEDYDEARDLNKVEIPGFGETWANAVDLCVYLKTEQDKKPIEETVREDPPVAVPGFVTVTAKTESLLCPDFGRKPFLYMIRLDRIDDVQEAKDGTACIFLKCEQNVLAPPIVTVEDFDEVARRMRRATEHAEDHRD